MSDHTGRNELCPCGSGKKKKACHPGGYAGVSNNRKIVIIGIGVALAAVVGVAMVQPTSTPTRQVRRTTPMTSPGTNAGTANSGSQGMQLPAGQGASAPPPGPAPEGQVWSPEHGHYHADPAKSAASAGTKSVQLPATQNANTPPPPGPAPAGKVWVPEHGHYHDAPKTTTATPAQGSGPK